MIISLFIDYSMMPSSSSSLCSNLLLMKVFLMIITLMLCQPRSISSIHTFDEHQILNVDIGQDVTMSCLFDQEKIDQVSFMRQMTGDILSVGKELFVNQNPSNEHLQLNQFSSNRLDLKILSVQENDSGIYTCMSNDEKLSSFLLQIFVPPRFVFYSPQEGRISLREGSAMNFSCHVDAVPPVNISWIYRNSHQQIKLLHQGEDLTIKSFEWWNSGSYECIASNDYHSSISRSFYVTIQYPPRLRLSNEEIRSDLQETVVIQCEVCSNPSIGQINWSRNGEILQDLNIIFKTDFLQDDCLQSTMEIIDISEFQFGPYECQAENSLGSNSISFSIEQISRIFKMKQQEFPVNRYDSSLISSSTEKSRSNQTKYFNESSRRSTEIKANVSHGNCFHIRWKFFLLIQFLLLLII